MCASARARTRKRSSRARLSAFSAAPAPATTAAATAAASTASTCVHFTGHVGEVIGAEELFGGGEEVFFFAVDVAAVGGAQARDDAEEHARVGVVAEALDDGAEVFSEATLLLVLGVERGDRRGKLAVRGMGAKPPSWPPRVPPP
jgi:hypothetical protein